jgi:putative addiction module killer protein
MLLKKTLVFTKWIEKLDLKIKTVIIANLAKLEDGNFSNVKSVGNGVHELKINYQKGYRVYFTNVDDKIIILLCAGNKLSQPKDIVMAKEIKKLL